MHDAACSITARSLIHLEGSKTFPPLRHYGLTEERALPTFESRQMQERMGLHHPERHAFGRGRSSRSRDQRARRHVRGKRQ